MFLIGLEVVNQQAFVLIRHLMFQKLHRLEDQNQFLLLEELLQISTRTRIRITSTHFRRRSLNIEGDSDHIFTSRVHSMTNVITRI